MSRDLREVHEEVLNWQNLLGLIKRGRVQNIGQGDSADDENWEHWMLISACGEQVVIMESGYKREVDRTDASTDADFDEDELLALAEAVGDLWNESAPKIERPAEKSRYFSW
jgi:hypothetical protein